MKPSKYNFLYTDVLPGNNSSVIYNSRTGILAALEPDKAEIVSRCINNDTAIEDSEFANQLYQCGIIVDDDFDEVKQIKMKLLESRYNNSVMNLTIAPTMSCNFACLYCFEKGHHHNERITASTIEKIANFIEQKAGHLEQLNVAWLGGEPLLAMPQLESISSRILDICARYNIKYTAVVITNGYLLDIDTAKKLKALGVRSIQATIDGKRDTHDKRRPLVDGNGTFDRIIENIKQVKDIIPIYVRINVDKDNQDQLNEIMQVFKENGLDGHVHPSLGHTVSYDDGYAHDICLTNKSYSKTNIKFMRENKLPVMDLYPKPKGSCCTADHSISYVIDTRGNIFKCWCDIGIESQRIYSLHEEFDFNTPLLHSYMLYDPTEDPHCKDCQYLPICMGGCPNHRIKNRDSCIQHKYNLDEYLVECARVLLEESVA